MDAVLELMVWSLRILMVGRWPEARHDGREWQRSDTPRKQRGFHSVLLQVRGDWPWLKTLFGSGVLDANICSGDQWSTAVGQQL